MGVPPAIGKFHCCAPTATPTVLSLCSVINTSIQYPQRTMEQPASTLTTKTVVAIVSGSQKRRPPAQVQVVQCGRAFPISTVKSASAATPIDGGGHHHGKTTVSLASAAGGTKQSRRSHDKNNSTSDHPNAGLEFDDVVRDVRKLAATAYVGPQKRKHDDEQYFQLTGRHRRSHHVPLPLVRALRKKAAERHARQVQHAQETGTVVPSPPTTSTATKKTTRQKDMSKMTRHFGPAPSIGFTSKGVYRVKNQTKDSRHGSVGGKKRPERR